MYCGVLNSQKSPVTVKCTYTVENGTTVPETKAAGNPIQEERLLVCGDLLRDAGIDLHISLSETCFIDTVTITFTQGFSCDEIAAFDGNGVFCGSYQAETGRKITTQKPSITTDIRTDSLLLRFSGSYDDIGIDKVELFGAVEANTRLFPEVKEYRLLPGEINPGAVSKIIYFGSEGKKAAVVFAGLWKEHTELIIEEICEVTEEQKNIALSTDNNICSVKFKKNTTISEDGYHLMVTPNEIVIEACNLRGMVIASHRLLQMTNETIPCCEIEDAPFMPFRMAHIYTPGYAEIEYAKRLIRHWISPMGYNKVIIVVAGGMRYESHPEISKAVLVAKENARNGIWPKFPFGTQGGDGLIEKKDLAEFVDYIRSFGIDVIPEVQSLGHVQYITLAHPEIAELDEETVEIKKVDERLADVPPSRFYHHCYCPSNEKSYEILFDLIDEIIEVFRPTEYVHMGHDEVYQIGVCPICRKRDPAELYEQDVLRIHDYLKKKGLKMMIWSDMLTRPDHYATAKAIHHLPTDILMMDFIWYFYLDSDPEILLLENGYRNIIGNLYSSHFPRYEERIRRKGMLGGVMSTWTIYNDKVLGQRGKMYDFMMTAELLWSERYDHRLRPTYNRTICELLPKMRDLVRNVKSPSNQRGSERKIIFEGNGSWNHEIMYNGKADSLIVTHTAPKKYEVVAWAPAKEIGHYELCYADGTNEKIPVAYGLDIGWAKQMYGVPLKGAYHRHAGYTATYFTDGEQERMADGSRKQWYRLEIINPYPEKKLACFRYVSVENPLSDVEVKRLEIVKLSSLRKHKR